MDVARCLAPLLLPLLFAFPAVAAEHTEVRQLSRIKMATVATSDVAAFSAWYTEWLAYELREAGSVSAAMGRSWGAPHSVGRPYVLLSPASEPDVHIRAVQSDAVDGYEPATTYGWNAFEIIIDDLDAVYEQMQPSPFRIIGHPRPLNAVPSIHAMQVVGPGEEILYLTTETGDRSKSNLPLPGGLISRLFIVVLGGPDIVELRDWYADTFRLPKNPIRASRGQIVQRAWGNPPGGTHPITLLRLREHGNSIELNGYTGGKGVRPKPDGQLPPGNAMVTFSVDDLDAFGLDFISPPAVLDGEAYGGRRSATFIGPAGELTELIEEPRGGVADADTVDSDDPDDPERPTR